VAGDDKWRAFRRLSQGLLVEEWTKQSFWRPPAGPSIARRAVGRARRLLGADPSTEIQLPR
jgi:hypothetical protein